MAKVKKNQYIQPQGTDILSTGESGGTKFLREDGDGTCSWQTVPGGNGKVYLPKEGKYRFYKYEK